MKTILVDCDGVLCDFVGGIRKYFRAHGVKDFAPETVKSYDMCSHFDDTQILAFHEASEDLDAAALDWYPGAQDFLASLKAVGKVVIVTAPWDPPAWIQKRNEWLEGHVEACDVLYVPTKHKRLVYGDALIEDNAQTLISWTGPEKILVNRPWNEHSTACDRHRYHTYEGIIDRLERVL